MQAFVLNGEQGLVGFISENAEGFHTIAFIGRKFETLGMRRTEQAAIDAISDRFRRDKITMTRFFFHEIEANVSIAPVMPELRKRRISVAC